MHGTDQRVEKLLVAPWGSPWGSSRKSPRGWGLQTYIYEGVQLQSKTSLDILARKLRPDKVLIVVLDTLATTLINTSSRYGYRELTDHIRNEIKTYIKNETEELKGRTVEIIVAPGVGRFRNGVFKGNLSDFYYFMCWELAKRMVDFYHSLKEVHLDLTHGVNFMPTLTYLSLKEIISALNIFKSGEGNRIKFRVYNSDPVVGEEMQKLEIHVVEESTPILFTPRLRVWDTDLAPIKPTSGEAELCKELYSKKLNEFRDMFNRGVAMELSAFFGSIFNGLPLAVASFFPENVDEIETAIERVISVFRNHIKVEIGDNCLNVHRELKFTEHFKFMTFVWVFAKLLQSTEVVECRMREVELNRLHTIKDRVFKWSDVLHIFLGREIGAVKEAIEREKPIKWTLLAHVLGEKGSDHIDPRNFLAQRKVPQCGRAVLRGRSPFRRYLWPPSREILGRPRGWVADGVFPRSVVAEYNSRLARRRQPHIGFCRGVPVPQGGKSRMDKKKFFRHCQYLQRPRAPPG